MGKRVLQALGLSWPRTTGELAEFWDQYSHHVNVIASKCDSIAYQVLSDPSVSKNTARMSEEGREAVAKEISERLLRREMLGWKASGHM